MDININSVPVVDQENLVYLDRGTRNIVDVSTEDLVSLVAQGWQELTLRALGIPTKTDLGRDRATRIDDSAAIALHGKIVRMLNEIRRRHP